MELRLILHTVLHLRMRQIVGQIWYRVFKPVYQSFSFAGEIARMDVVAFIRKPFSWDGKNFSFLNLVSPFSSWNDTSQGMLWAYNLNYMDWILQEGATYEEGEKWIDKFCQEISGNKVGLDPYPIALRGINWIKFIVQYADRIPIQKREMWTNSLYSQYCLLARKLEYHLLGNHLLEDAYSLYIASLYFQDKKLYRKASKLLKQELKEQVLPDGAHYEQSPMYHCILLDRLLDCYNFSVHNVRFGQQREMNNFLEDKVKQMLGWLKAIIYEDGSLPLLNDSANGIAPTSREIFDYARRLGLIIEESRLKESGYRKIQLEWGEVILDIGGITASYQPGHSHADTFNYELKIDGHPFIIDTGISTYNKTERRQWERGTAAHGELFSAHPFRADGIDDLLPAFRLRRRKRHAEVEVLFPRAVLRAGRGAREQRRRKQTANKFFHSSSLLFLLFSLHFAGICDRPSAAASPDKLRKACMSGFPASLIPHFPSPVKTGFPDKVIFFVLFAEKVTEPEGAEPYGPAPSFLSAGHAPCPICSYS